MSAGAKTLRHVQTSASTEWTINHNFGVKPICEVVVDNNGQKVKMLPANIVYQNDNTVVITFSIARSGYATLIG